MQIAGKTALERVLERCRAVEMAQEICCAVPEGAQDDAVAREAERWGARVVRGSETDVLDRYYRAAQVCGADVVMRVTSDCPLLDPYVARQVLAAASEGRADYVCNNLPRSWPHGLDCEAFSFGWLERAAREARSAAEREHVTPYIRNHPDARKMYVTGPGGAAARHRWTLDTAEDLAFLRTLFMRMPEGAAGFDYRVPLAIVEADPTLAAMNTVQL